MWISIPKRHIVVWDSIVPHISREDLELVMEPFVTMVPYMLVECAATDEQRVQHILEPYTYERVTIGFCNKNVKAIREKMALDIVKETPECHSKENEDNDENMGTYDSHGKMFFYNTIRIGCSFFVTYPPTKLSFSRKLIAPTKILILISFVSPDHALLLEESMCMPQLVV
ncbi:unnamed protein product [Brassica rapa]|uniref:Uncharacterized protein n=1 Tax=Brassica campestris TaxID=3711 RepID=A0A8D9LVR9_BRACM|nr:unnamed protein product [Brassica rapa]